MADFRRRRVQSLIQRRRTMEQRRVSGELTNNRLILIFRWNAARNVYEIHEDRRDVDADNRNWMREEWNRPVYVRPDSQDIIQENNNQSEILGRDSLVRIRIEEGTTSFENNSTCCICLEELLVGSEAIQVPSPCFHVYHEECVMKWLERTNSCPLCRRSIS